MPQPLINIGAAINDGTGELGPRGWLQKINRLPNPDNTVNPLSGDYAGTYEQKITAAIADGVATGKKYCWITQPYTASLVTFNTALQMIREGADPSVYDLKAYGAVGNGVANDTVAIQAWLAAAAGRHEAFAPLGTYLFSATLTVPSNLSLRGEDDFLTIFKLVDASNVLMMQSVNQSQISLRRATFDAGTQAGINTTSLQFDGCADVLIQDCRFLNGKMPIWLRGTTQACARVRIDNNYFGSVVDHAIRANEVTFATDVWVTNNYIANVTAGVIASPAAIMVHANHAVISQNEIASSVDTCIMATAAGAIDTVIEDNLCTSTKVGIFVGSGTVRVIIRGNDITAGTDFGISLLNAAGGEISATIEGNLIHDCGKSGIDIEGVTGVTIIGNTIIRVGTNTGAADNQRAGIATVTQGGNLVGRITITGNTIRDDAGVPTMRYGIYLQSVSSRMFCFGNSVQGAIVANHLISAGTTAPYYYETDLGIDTSDGIKRLAGVGIVAPTYGASVAIDASAGNFFSIVVTNATPFTVTNPGNTVIAQEITIMITNVSGGAMGAITWGANFRLAGAFTNPANNQRRLIRFFSLDGTSNWFEQCRTAVDQAL